MYMDSKQYYNAFVNTENSAKLFEKGCRYLEEWKNIYNIKEGATPLFSLLDIMKPSNAACIWLGEWPHKSIQIMQMWQNDQNWEEELMKSVDKGGAK